MWCIHHKKQVCWTYWIFNQLLGCAPRKDAMLTHGHMITIIAKAFNVDLFNFTRTVECSYFTKQAFVRGEIVDYAFRLISAKMRSYWRGLAPPPPVEEHPMEEEEEFDPEEVVPLSTPFSGVPLLTYPLQNAPGSSSDHPPIWDQILNNQLAMQGQLNEMAFHQQQLARRQRKMEYKIGQFFAQSGYQIDSPPSTPTDD